MILQCPHCSRRYLVQQNQISTGGREVKCSKCLHQWHQKPVVANNEHTTNADIVAARIMTANARPVVKVAPIPAGSELPVIAKVRYPVFKQLACAAFLCVAIMGALITYADIVMQNFPFLAPAYEQVGIYNSKGIALVDVSYESLNDAGQNELKINGMVVNEATTAKTMPHVRISMLDSNRQVIKSVLLKTGDGKILPGHQLYFSNIVSKPKTQMSDIVVDIGNVLEIHQR